MKKNKIIALALTSVLSLCILSGCSDTTTETENSKTDKNTQTNTNNQQTDTNDQQDSKDIVLKIDDIEISISEYAYYFNKAYMTLDQEFGGYLSYGQAVEGMPTLVELNEMVSEYAVSLAQQDLGIITLLEKLGVEATEEDEAELALMIQETILSLGGEENYIGALLELGISREKFEEESMNTLLFQNCIENIYGNNNLTEEELYKVYEKEFLKAKHILIPFETELEGFTDEEIYDYAVSVAEEVLQRLENGEDFDLVMAEENADYGQPISGYAFVEGTMVAEFEEAVKGLKENEVSGLIETYYGFHIIKRIEASTENFEENQSFILAGDGINKATEALYGEVIDSQEVELLDDISKVDITSYLNYIAQ